MNPDTHADTCCDCTCSTTSTCPPCPNCFAGDVPFVKCSTPIDITGANVQGLGWYKPGKFYVAYCSGAWNYRDGWMVTRFPASADQWNSGHAIYVGYGSLSAIFNETQPAGAGYASPALAEAGAAGAFVALDHPGGNINLLFTDEEYDDNFPPTLPKTTPIFALYGAGYDIDQALQPMGCCGYDNGDGTWTLTLRFKNISDVPLTFDGTLTGALTVNNNPAHIDNMAAGSTSGMAFNVTLTSGKAITVTLTAGISGTTWGTLTYDLTPTVVATVVGVGIDHLFCSGSPQRVNLTYQYNGFSFDDLVISFRTGGDVAGIRNWEASCVSQTDYDVGSNGNLFCFIDSIGVDVDVTGGAHPSTISMTVDYKDGATILQTSTYIVPMVWV